MGYIIPGKSWKIVEARKTRPSPVITLTKSKTFRINAEAIKEFKLTNKNYAKIFIDSDDPEIYKIGFLFLEAPENLCYTLFSKSKTGAMISAHSVLKEIGFENKDMDMTNRRFAPYIEKTEVGDLIVINIPKIKKRLFEINE